MSLFFSACKDADKTSMEFNYKADSQFSADLFKNPPSEYRVVPFWSWNEKMEPDEIRRQLRLMKEAGWGGSMVHSRTGLLTEYLGEDWFKAVDATIDESEKQGMLVWLYDEDKWPSGYSGGAVLKEDTGNAVKVLYARKVGDKPSDNSVKMGEPCNGMQIYSRVEPQGNPWFNGTSYVDTMSRKAMSVFKREAYDSYYKRYKKYFGSLIVAEFTDEPALASHYKGSPAGVVYSSDIVEAFKKEYGFDPVPHFHKLFADCDGAKKFRLQYFRTANKLFELNFVKLLGDACAERNIALTGHCMAEEPIFYQHLWSGRVMPYYRHMGIPGIDHLGRQVGNPLTGKQCQSVCNQYGKMRMLSELYGVAGGSLTFEDRQWIANQQFVVGVNMLVPHLSLFSQTGCRKRDFPQNINYQQSWWKLNGALDVPLARACYALSQGKYAADILLITPQESAATLWQREVNATSSGVPAETLKKGKHIQDALKTAAEDLLASQLTFDLGDEQLLEEDGFVKGNTIGIKQMSYKAVLLPEAETMRPATLKRLKEFMANGGVVLRLGAGATLLDGEKSEELEKFMASVKRVDAKDVRAELKKSIPPMLEIDGKSGDRSRIWTHIRNFNDGSRLVMLTNLSRESKYEGSLKIFGEYTRAQLFDLDSGDIRDVYAANENGTLMLPLELECAGSIFLRVSKEKPSALSTKKSGVLRTRELSDWKAGRLDDNSMILDYASFSFDGGKRGIEGEIPAIEVSRYLNTIKYDGDLTVKYKFNAKDFDASRKLRLVAEYPERAAIKVNGREVKYAGLPFWKDFRWLPIDITGLVKDGQNVIEMHYKDFKFGDPTVYKPQWRRYGTEIEAVYLVGDFSVVSNDTGMKCDNAQAKWYRAKPTKTNYIRKSDLALTNPQPLKFGNQTVNGLPFYAGRLSYTADIDVKLSQGERLAVRLGDMDVPVCEVFVDGKSVGVIKHEPFELDITSAVEGKQKVRLQIVCYATLRNIMDVLHNKIGELYSVWPNRFYIEDISPLEGADKMFEKLNGFADGSWKSKLWISDYCQASFGNLEKVELLTKK